MATTRSAKTVGGRVAAGAEGGGDEDAHRLLAGGDDPVGVAFDERTGRGDRVERLVERGVELVQRGDGRGPLRFRVDAGEDAEVPLADGGGDLGRPADGRRHRRRPPPRATGW